MNFSILTIHPEIFEGFTKAALIGKAIEKRLIDIRLLNVRDFSQPPHHRVDDKSYGGGPGMVMMVEPIVKSLRSIALREAELGVDKKNIRTILLSAKGRRFTQKNAKRLSRYKSLRLICGRYEGVDERIAEHFIDEEVRIGDYVLMGGEVAAMVMVESIARWIPNVLGNSQSLESESFSEHFKTEYGQYTRPRDFEGLLVPEVLVKGNHGEIEKWRASKTKNRSLAKRPGS